MRRSLRPQFAMDGVDRRLHALRNLLHVDIGGGCRSGVPENTLIQRDRLVVCLRADNPLAAKASLQPADVLRHPKVFYYPQRHPQAHARLVELLAEVGVRITEYSRASHPSEMQSLVKQGFGFALIREGTILESELTTRPVAGVTWTVDTAFIYNKQSYPKTLPVLIRLLKSRMGHPSANGKKPPRSSGKGPEQMSLLDGDAARWVSAHRPILPVYLLR